jgi:sulfotransferase family protein
MTTPTVLYITGMTRCGSTMIGNVLNELPDAVHVGELHFLWRNGILRTGTNDTCGCGESVLDCPLWSNVVKPDPTGAATMAAVQDRRFRARHMPRRLAELHGLARAPADVRWATGVTRALYEAVLDRCSARVVVDSSKYPAEAAALLARDDLDVRVLHVVRDPRATALSYGRDKSYVTRMSAARSTAYWSAVNLASDLLGLRSDGRYLRVRHEDFGRQPRQVIAEIMRFAGLAGPNPVDHAGNVVLAGNHTVTGNPDRLQRGRVAIHADERWRTDLAWRSRMLATTGAGPQLLRYGYARPRLVLTNRSAQKGAS